MQGLRICVLLALLFAVCSCSEQFHYFFPTTQEAMESEVSKHGWIPSWFPKAASEIHLQYDIDTNNRWYKFRLPKEGKENIVRNFVKLAWKQVEGIPTPKPRGADWWFEGLIQQQPANSHAALYADIYQGMGKIVGSNVFLAMDETKDSVFIWICGHD